VKVLGRVQLLNRTSDPSSPPDGEIWYNSTGGQFKGQSASATQIISPLPYPFFHVPDPKTGVWYIMGTGASSTSGMTQSRLTYFPFVMPKAVTLARWAVRVTTLAAGSTFRGGLYAADSTGQLPGSLIYEDTGTLSGASAATVQRALGTAQALTAHTKYFWAIVAQGGAPSAQIWGAPNPYIADDSAATPATPGNPSVAATVYFEAGVTGALPSTAGAVGGSVSGAAPGFWFAFS
jgi:hypothetical protein